MQNVQLPLVPLAQVQFQPHQGQDQFQGQIQVQAQRQSQPQPQPQPQCSMQPQEYWLNQQGQFPDNPSAQPWGNFPTQPWHASKPKSRKVRLLEREANDLSFKSAKEKWLYEENMRAQESIRREKWLEEENMKAQDLIKYQASVIYSMSEKERLTKNELARTNRRLMICERRSKKIKAANVKMLEYICKK